MLHQTNLATSSNPGAAAFSVRYCPVSFHVPLLRDPQRNKIFEAIERVGLDQMAFELTERAKERDLNTDRQDRGSYSTATGRGAMRVTARLATVQRHPSIGHGSL
jgi:hypothetical protein